ncbi:MAG: division/cell wall cluster transcriptional repressor MraZ [Clostridiales bacterium]|nr:division/cell wall cluster transcriptional repressor MraZ [Clostridiales bacterium]
MYFKGTYEHTMDIKGRIFIPAKFREGLGEDFVVCKGFFEPCLYIYSNEEFQNLSSKLDNLPFANKDAMRLQRELYANASDVTVDKQGRILIPSPLREHAHLEKEAVVAGVRTHVEIWDPELWKREREQSPGIESYTENLRNQGVML